MSVKPVQPDTSASDKPPPVVLIFAISIPFTVTPLGKAAEAINAFNVSVPVPPSNLSNALNVALVLASNKSSADVPVLLSAPAVSDQMVQNAIN
jgi:hypothetical protein